MLNAVFNTKVECNIHILFIQLERLLIFPPTTKFMKKSGYVKQHYNVTYHSLVSERIERASDQQPKRPEKFNTKFQRKVNSNDQ